MPKKSIDELNKKLTPEQRKESARKAGSAPKKKRVKTIRQLAKFINGLPAPYEARKMMRDLGIPDDDMTNAAMIVAAVLRSAFEGDLRAVEKWEEYVGQKPMTAREKAELEMLREKVKQIKSGKDGGSVPIILNVTPRGGDDQDESS